MCSTLSDSSKLDLESDKLAENFALPYTVIVWLQKISISPPRIVIWFVTPPHLEFPVKSSAVEIPHPLRIFDDLLLCRYDYFWIRTRKQGLEKVLSSCPGQVDSPGQVKFIVSCLLSKGSGKTANKDLPGQANF